jgi:hypothetical protein
MPRSHQHPSNGPPGRPRSADDEARDALREVAGSLIPKSSKQPMGLYLCRPEDEVAALPLHVERSVFEESIPNAADLLVDEFGPYEHATLLLCVIDQHRRLPAAMLRLIFPSTQGLKTLNDIEPIWGLSTAQLYERSGIEYESAHTWDIATLAIAPEYRAAAFQGVITMALCQTLSVLGMRCEFTSSVAVLHLPVLRMLQWKLHRPFTEFADVEPRGYLESPASLPVWMRLEDWHQRLFERDRVLYDIMTSGTGLESVVRPPDWDGAAELAAEVSALADLRLHLQ